MVMNSRPTLFRPRWWMTASETRNNGPSAARTRSASSSVPAICIPAADDCTDRAGANVELADGYSQLRWCERDCSVIVGLGVDPGGERVDHPRTCRFIGWQSVEGVGAIRHRDEPAKDQRTLDGPMRQDTLNEITSRARTERGEP